MGLIHGISKTPILQANIDSGIVTDGLVLLLDAGRSYPGTGPIWFDYSGNGNHFNLSGSPTYSTSNSGYFVFDGTNDYAEGPYNRSSLQLTGDITVDVWLYVSARALDWVRIFGLSGTNYNLVRTYGLWHDITGRVLWQRYGGVDPGIYPATPTLNLNTWYNIVATTSGTSHILYLNNSSVGTATAAGPWTLGDQEPTLGYTGSFHTYHNGRIAVAKVYNRGLSGTEVTQNYNALKARYGL